MGRTSPWLNNIFQTHGSCHAGIMSKIFQEGDKFKTLKIYWVVLTVSCLHIHHSIKFILNYFHRRRTQNWWLSFGFPWSRSRTSYRHPPMSTYPATPSTLSLLRGIYGVQWSRLTIFKVICFNFCVYLFYLIYLSNSFVFWQYVQYNGRCKPSDPFSMHCCGNSELAYSASDYLGVIQTGRRLTLLVKMSK